MRAFVTWQWHVRLQSVTALILKIQILSDVTVSRWLCTSQHLKIYCPFWTLGCQKHPISQRQIPEDLNFHVTRCFNIKTCHKVVRSIQNWSFKKNILGNLKFLIFVSKHNGTDYSLLSDWCQRERDMIRSEIYVPEIKIMPPLLFENLNFCNVS
jgi:hypothetical protein